MHGRDDSRLDICSHIVADRPTSWQAGRCGRSRLGAAEHTADLNTFNIDERFRLHCNLNTFNIGSQEEARPMDLRLVEYVAYLAIGVGLTFVGQVLYRSGAAFLVDALQDRTLADSTNRLLVVGFYLIGLGGGALLLSVDSTLVSAADVVKAVVVRSGMLFLVLGGLHMANLLALRRMRRATVQRAPVSPPATPPYAPTGPATGRFPY
jgi:hypothetical protein